MIKVDYVEDIDYLVVCYGCGARVGEKGVRIEVYDPARLRGAVVYLCDTCRRELYEKI